MIQTVLRAIKIKYKWILSFLIIFTLTSGLNSGCIVAADNSTNTSINTGETVSSPSTGTVNSGYNIPSAGNDFIVGYYINPSATPISQIDFQALKSAGITDIYVLVKNDNYLPVLTEAKKKADAVGIRTTAWVFPGFKYASKVADMKIGVQLDVETYNMPKYVMQIFAMRLATKGVPFSVTVKPDIWDGSQHYYLIVPFCDYVVPQLYMGDFNRGMKGLTNWVKIYNTIYPGKIVVGLQTYQSYQNTSLKSSDTILKEINAVKPYSRGVILFRYGLSNYNG